MQPFKLWGVPRKRETLVFRVGRERGRNFAELSSEPRQHPIRRGFFALTISLVMLIAFSKLFPDTRLENVPFPIVLGILWFIVWRVLTRGALN